MTLFSAAARPPEILAATALMRARPFEALGHFRESMVARASNYVPSPVRNFFDHAAVRHVEKAVAGWSAYYAHDYLTRGLTPRELPLVEHALRYGFSTGILLGLTLYTARWLAAPTKGASGAVAQMILKGDHAGAKQMVSELPFPLEKSVTTSIMTSRIGWALAILCPVIPVLGFLQERFDVLGIRTPANLAAVRMLTPPTDTSGAQRAVRLAQAGATAVATHWLPMVVLFRYLFF